MPFSFFWYLRWRASDSTHAWHGVLFLFSSKQKKYMLESFCYIFSYRVPRVRGVL